MSLSIWDKFQIVQKIYIVEGVGEIFNPQYASRDYGVSFMELQYKEDYASYLGVAIGADGISPHLETHFTDEGLKKLLKTNKAMIDEVNRLFDELASVSRARNKLLKKNPQFDFRPKKPKNSEKEA